jgi:hypothetical protein
MAQVRPGEQRNDCGGCHAHSQLPLPFSNTAVTKIVIAVTDAYTGINLSSLSIKADFTVNIHAANTELNGFFTAMGDGVRQLNLDSPWPVNTLKRHILAEVKGNQGNFKGVGLRFFTSGDLSITHLDSDILGVY